MDFYCAEKTCPFRGTEPYQVRLPSEVLVDEHNCAVLFCPHCQRPLVKKDDGGSTADVE